MSENSLNAPCGAGCFRTAIETPGRRIRVVLMHLVVLGAFGLPKGRRYGVVGGVS